MAPTNTAIPAGHTFLNIDNFMTIKGKEMVEDLLKKAASRNPDAFDMYIYNDFYSFAVLDLVDKTMAAMHSKILKKDWDEAYSILEALTVFNDLEPSWSMCEDGDRTSITNKVYGACVITILRALKKEERLDVNNFPSLECLLKNIAEWGDAMKQLSCDHDYFLVCKAIGERLFKDKTNRGLALDEARLQEWANGLDDNSRDLVRKKLKEIAKKKERAPVDGKQEKPWYVGAGEDDEDKKDPDFALPRVWKEYKKYLSGVPSKPLRGPENWDISKWTTAQRKEFEFDVGSVDGDDDD